MQEMQKVQAWSVAKEDPLQEGMATHTSILAWRIPWTEEPGGLQSIGLHSQTQWKQLNMYILMAHKTPQKLMSSNNNIFTISYEIMD